MVLEKKSDVGYDKKSKKKGNTTDGVLDEPEKEEIKYKRGVVGGGGCG